MNISYQVEKPLENLPNENIYGEVFIPREKMISAMEKLGLKIEDATGRNRSSAIRFRGEIEGIKVIVNGNAMRLMPKRFSGAYGFDYIQTYNPSESEAVSHFKLKAWIPAATHLFGKGRDGKAWAIYHAIFKAITEE